MKYIILIITVHLSGCLLGQEPKNSDSLVNKSIDERENFLIGFPAAFYTPETGWGFGAGGVYNFYLEEKDTVSPSSQIQLAASYTQKNQVLFYLPYKFYWNEFENIIEGEFGYYDYLYPFYGQGIHSKEEDFENYNSRYFRFQFDGFKRLNNSHFLGVRLWFDNPDIYKVREEGVLDDSNISGKTGGRISGIGPQYRMDRRDNVYSAKSGSYANILYQGFNKAIGSEFNWNRIRIDLRKYHLVNRVTLAAQLYSDINWGDVPFFQQARLGGTKRLRGYLEGRFLDDISITPQVETRFPLYKRRFGGVFFGGIGTVMNELSDLQNSIWKPSFGGGVRYTLDLEKGVNVRFDYAFTPEGSNFYFTIGESF